MPKVSVLTPIYKTNEKYLREAIESILNQTYKDFEFLLLDDCPENTRENIIKEYQNKDNRIKYYKNDKNLGISESRNKLINLSNGEYLAVFDHDDISLSTRLEKEVKYLDEHIDVGVVGTQFKNIISNHISHNYINDKDIKIDLMSRCAIYHSSSMIRKSILIDNNIFYESEFSPAEDYRLWCQLIDKTKFHNLDEILFYYRDYKENTSSKYIEKIKIADFVIRQLAKNKYPKLYYESCLKAIPEKFYIKLFNCFTLFRIKKTPIYTKYYLFGKIPLFTIRNWK